MRYRLQPYHLASKGAQTQRPVRVNPYVATASVLGWIGYWIPGTLGCSWRLTWRLQGRGGQPSVRRSIRSRAHALRGNDARSPLKLFPGSVPLRRYSEIETGPNPWEGNGSVP